MQTVTTTTTQRVILSVIDTSAYSQSSRIQKTLNVGHNWYEGEKRIQNFGGENGDMKEKSQISLFYSISFLFELFSWETEKGKQICSWEGVGGY
jgi:hypothetical protein